MKFSKPANIYLKSVVVLFLLTLLGVVANASLTNFYPTAASELDDLLEVCKEKRVSGVEETVNELDVCLRRTLANPRSMANISSNDNRILECRDPRNYRECFNPVARKIDECVPGRGKTVQKIQNALYNQFCMDGGNVLKILERSAVGDGCSPNYEVSQCTSDAQRNDWNSLDECKSFRAFRLCQNTAMSPCSNDALTKLILDSYGQVGKDLNCSTSISIGAFIIPMTWSAYLSCFSLVFSTSVLLYD